ncbi:hypothetical protein DB354_19380 [Opitutus sp. ER46]|nr:hypothetical protein DB354_19380 [Opitutus sp. ER46]
MSDVRVFAEDAASIVFELPLRGTYAELSSDKFQALFRVNKAQRGFEEITIKLRAAFRVAGVAKVTDVGMGIRFRTFDPALAPQPVLLRARGAASLLLLKVSRSYEVARSDFLRVDPWRAPATD